MSFPKRTLTFWVALWAAVLTPGSSGSQLCHTIDGLVTCHPDAFCEADERRTHHYFCGCNEFLYGNGIDGCSKTDLASIPMRSDNTLLGCYSLEKNEFSSIFAARSGADYYDHSLDILSCVQVCLRGGFNFMFLVEGDKCLCGVGSELDLLTLTNDSFCDQPCSGNADEFCGGSSLDPEYPECDVCAKYMHLLALTAQASYVESLSIDLIASMEKYGGDEFVYSDLPVNVHADMALSTPELYGQEYCQLYVENVLYSTMRKCQFDQLSLSVPGSYLFVVTVLGSQEKSTSAGLKVKERHLLVGNELICPPNPNKAGEFAVLAVDGKPCVVRVLSGSDLVIKVNFGDSSIDEFFPMDDPIQHTFGLPIPASIPFDNEIRHFYRYDFNGFNYYPKQEILFFPHKKVTNAGVLRSLETHLMLDDYSRANGLSITVTIGLVRVVCATSGTEYCCASGACVNSGECSSDEIAAQSNEFLSMFSSQLCNSDTNTCSDVSSQGANSSFSNTDNVEIIAMQDVPVVVEPGLGPSGVKVVANFLPTTGDNLIEVVPCDFVFLSIPPLSPNSWWTRGGGCSQYTSLSIGDSQDRRYVGEFYTIDDCINEAYKNYYFYNFNGVSIANSNIDNNAPYACYIEVGQARTTPDTGYHNCFVPEYWRLQPNLPASGTLDPGERVLNCDKAVVALALAGAGQQMDLTSCDWTSYDKSYKYEGSVFTDLAQPGPDFYVGAHVTQLAYASLYRRYPDNKANKYLPLNVELRPGSYFQDNSYRQHASQLPLTFPAVSRLVLQPISALDSKIRELNSGAIDYNFLSRGSYLELVLACTECTCSHSTTWISWGDGEVTEFANTDDLCRGTTQNHLYSINGVFSLCVTVANDLSSESFCREVLVLNPVPPADQIEVEIYAECSGDSIAVVAANTPVCYKISFTQNLPESEFPSSFSMVTQFKYRVDPDFSDDQQIAEFVTPQVWYANGTYTEPGLFAARVSLFNRISSSLVYRTVGVYEVIDKCDTEPFWKFPKEPAEAIFLKPGSQTDMADVYGFDKDVDICFNISKNTSPGSDDSTQVTCQGVGDTSNLFALEGSSLSLLCFRIPQNDTYDCFVSVSNPVSDCNDLRTIKVDKPIKGFKPVSYNVFPPDVPGRVGFSAYDNGEKMCVLIYCSDNCTSNFLVMYHQEDISLSGCKSFDSYSRASQSCGADCHEVTQLFSSTSPDLIEVPSQNQGSIVISYVAWNSVSLIEAEKTVAVTTESCNYPNLKVINGGDFYYEPETIFKKAPVELEGEIYVVCQETDKNEISWCFSRYDEVSGEIVNISNPDQKLLGHLDDICMPIDLPSAKKPTLVLTEEFLATIPYGHYRFVFKVTMEKPAGSTRTFEFSSYESAYVSFEPSALVGRIFEDVNEITVSRGQTLTLTPELYSYDPDDTSLIPYNFVWWCRHQNEAFKTDLEGNWRQDYPPFLESYEFPGAAGGCDGNGPGRTGASGGSLDMKFNFEPGIYVVVATFEVDNSTGRTGIAQLTVEVSQSTTSRPILKIFCGNGTKCYPKSKDDTSTDLAVKINKNGNLRLFVTCTNFCPQSDASLACVWTTEYRLPGASEDQWEPLNCSMSNSTSFRTQYFVHQTCFLDHVVDYRTKASCFDNSTDEDEGDVMSEEPEEDVEEPEVVFGSTTLYYATNQPCERENADAGCSGHFAQVVFDESSSADPYGPKPESKLEAAMYYNISCSGFVDPDAGDAIVKYKLYGVNKMKKTGGDIIFEGQSSFITKLAPGPSNQNFVNEYYVIMEDKYSARCKSDVFEIQVLPPNCKEVNSAGDDFCLATNTSVVYAVATSFDLMKEVDHVIDTTVVKHYSESSSVNVTQDLIVLSSLSNLMAKEQLREIRHFAGVNNLIPMPRFYACQGSNVSIECPPGATIKIDVCDMFYGVRDTEQCADVLPSDLSSPLTYKDTFSDQSVICERPKIYTMAATECDGKESCYFEIEDEDPETGQLNKKISKISKYFKKAKEWINKRIQKKGGKGIKWRSKDEEDCSENPFRKVKDDVEIIPVGAYASPPYRSFSTIDKALDGEKKKDDFSEQSCYSSKGSALPHFAVFQLPNPTIVTSVEVLNRGDCCSELLESTNVEVCDDTLTLCSSCSNFDGQKTSKNDLDCDDSSKKWGKVLSGFSAFGKKKNKRPPQPKWDGWQETVCNVYGSKVRFSSETSELQLCEVRINAQKDFEKHREKYEQYLDDVWSASENVVSNSTNTSKCSVAPSRDKDIELFSTLMSSESAFSGKTPCDLDTEISKAICTNNINQLQCDATTKMFTATYECARNFEVIKVTKPVCLYLKCRTCFSLVTNNNASWLTDFLEWKINFDVLNNLNASSTDVTLENVCGPENEDEMSSGYEKCEDCQLELESLELGQSGSIGSAVFYCTEIYLHWYSNLIQRREIRNKLTFITYLIVDECQTFTCLSRVLNSLKRLMKQPEEVTCCQNSQTDKVLEIVRRKIANMSASLPDVEVQDLESDISNIMGLKQAGILPCGCDNALPGCESQWNEYLDLWKLDITYSENLFDSSSTSPDAGTNISLTTEAQIPVIIQTIPRTTVTYGPVATFTPAPEAVMVNQDELTLLEMEESVTSTTENQALGEEKVKLADDAFLGQCQMSAPDDFHPEDMDVSDMTMVAGENLDEEDEDGKSVEFSKESLTPKVQMISADDMSLDTTASRTVKLVTSMTPSSSLSSIKHADELNEAAPLLSISVKTDGVRAAIKETKKLIKVGIPQGSASVENKKNKRKVSVKQSELKSRDVVCALKKVEIFSDVAIVVEIEPHCDYDAHLGQTYYGVGIKYSKPPTSIKSDQFDFLYRLPRDNYTEECTDDGTFCSDMTFKIVIDNLMETHNFGDYYVCIWGEHKVPSGFEMYYPAQFFANKIIPCGFDLIVKTTACMYTEPGETDYFSSAGCQVMQYSDSDKTWCACNHLSSFTGAVLPAFPKVDLSAAAFDPRVMYPVYLLLGSIWLAFFLLLFYLRSRDRADIEKIGAAPLTDNKPSDGYLYEIEVQTGVKKGAGTTSNVYFILYGDYGETGTRHLHDGERKILQRDQKNLFLMATPGPLGPLNLIRIWIDCSGKGKENSWYLDQVVVRDVQTGARSYFVAHKWWSLTEGDGMTDRMLHVASPEQRQAFQHLFVNKARDKFDDDHIYFSLFCRPPESNFTRCQRLVCCLCLLLLEFTGSAMYYERNVMVSAPKYTIGPISFKSKEFIISLMSSVVVVPISLLLVQLFRHIGPRPISKEDRLKREELRHIEQSEGNGDLEEFDFESDQELIDGAEEKGTPKTIDVADPRSSREVSNDALSESQTALIIEEETCESPISVNFTNRRTSTAKTERTAKTENSLKEAESEVNRLMIELWGDDENQDPETLKTERRVEDTLHDIDMRIIRLRGFVFPHQFLALVWLLALGVAIMTTGYLLLVSISISSPDGGSIAQRRAKVSAWVTSMIGSIFMSIFFVQPVKIFGVAIFYSMVCKPKKSKLMEEYQEDDQNNVLERLGFVELAENEEYIGKHQPSYLPPMGSKTGAQKKGILRDLKAEQRSQKKLNEVLLTIFFYVMLTSFVYAVIYTERDENTAMLYHHMYYKLNGTLFPKLMEITRPEHILQYLRNTYIPLIYAQKWYGNQNPLGLFGYTDDKINFLLGYSVIRQARVQTGHCLNALSNNLKPCSAPYSFELEEKARFCENWELSLKDDPCFFEEFQYTHASEIQGTPKIGWFAAYSGGGYVVRLDGSQEDTSDKVDWLFDNKWIDSHTRAIMLEFTVFNPSTNLFGVCTVMFEIPVTSLIYTSFHLTPLRLKLLNDGDIYNTLVLAGALIMLNLQFLLSLHKLYKIRFRRYFSDVWNILDMLIVACGWACTCIWFVRYVKGEQIIHRMSMYGGRQYVNMGEIATMTTMYTYMLGAISFFTTLRFLWLLKFNKRIASFIDTLRQASEDLKAYGSIFMIIFIGYSTAVYVVFGSKLLKYSTLKLVMESLFSALLGKFEMAAIFEADPVMGPYLFMSYCLTMAIVGLNLFICILNISIQEVREDMLARSNDFEIVDFLIKKISRITGKTTEVELKTIKDEIAQELGSFRMDLSVLDRKWKHMRESLRLFMQNEQNEFKYRIDQLENESDDETWQTAVEDECKYYDISSTTPNPVRREKSGFSKEQDDMLKKLSVNSLREEIALIEGAMNDLDSSSSSGDDGDLNTEEDVERLIREVSRSSTRTSRDSRMSTPGGDSVTPRQQEKWKRRFVRYNFKREHLEDM